MARSEPLRVAIIGVGLIGGSLAMAWKAHGIANEVVGIARRPDTIAEAVTVGAVDRGTLSLEEGVHDADVVVVATPVGRIAQLVEKASPHLKEGAVVTDVGSTKGALCRRIWETLPPRCVFVGGHPMAGSERTGVLAADPYLFQNAPYIFVPPAGCPVHVLDLLQELARAAGAHPLIMEADEHDAIVATVSHLPHMVAAALVNAAVDRAADFPNLLQLAAGGFRDTTRVASGSEDVWTDICLTNVPQIVAAIEIFEKSLSSFKASLVQRDSGRLRAELGSAREARATLPAKSKGILKAVYDLVVHVVDRPGAIHAVTGIIGSVEINVIDIEIMRVREGEGGTLRLGFESLPDLETAARLLMEAGYQVRRRTP